MGSHAFGKSYSFNRGLLADHIFLQSICDRAILGNSQIRVGEFLFYQLLLFVSDAVSLPWQLNQHLGGAAR
jgi:hypothetical protein